MFTVKEESIVHIFFFERCTDLIKSRSKSTRITFQVIGYLVASTQSEPVRTWTKTTQELIDF